MPHFTAPRAFTHLNTGTLRPARRFSGGRLADGICNTGIPAARAVSIRAFCSITCRAAFRYNLPFLYYYFRHRDSSLRPRRACRAPPKDAGRGRGAPRRGILREHRLCRAFLYSSMHYTLPATRLPLFILPSIQALLNAFTLLQDSYPFSSCNGDSPAGAAAL